jgi:transcriptional regulator with XRE-family HTH domain
MRGVRINSAIVRALRSGCAMTQDELAARAGVDVRTIRHAEYGNKKLDYRTVMAIANALGCESRELTINSSAKSSDRCRLPVDVVRRWLDSVLAQDLDTLLSLHTDYTVLEILAADGLPVKGRCRGRDSLRRYLRKVAQTVRVTSVSDHDFRVHAVDRFVFLRMTVTMEYVPLKKSFRARQFDEFEFRDGLIGYRANMADWGPLRKIIE